MDGHEDWWLPRSPLFRRLARDLEVHVLAANAGAALSSVAMPMERTPPPFDPVEFGRDLKWGAGWAAWYAAAEELP